jgi:ribosomal protein L18E
MLQQISKTKIEKRMKEKKDPNLVRTIIKLKKTNTEIAKELAKPKRKWPAINLKDIDMIEGDIIIAGKILSAGETTTKKKVVAWSASTKAKEKMKEAGITFNTIEEEITNNPELNNLKLIK